MKSVSRMYEECLNTNINLEIKPFKIPDLVLGPQSFSFIAAFPYM